MECPICCETFNKSSHLKVDCKGCDGDSACRTCCQTYILNSSQSEPCCMFCKNPWERDFMNFYLTKKFVNNDLKNHVENVFLEQQISLLPATQQAARQEKRIREIRVELEKANTVLNQIKKALADQLEIIKAYNLNIYRLKNGGEERHDEPNNFTHKCKITNCNGFLDNRHKCQLCETKFCGKCMEIKETEHECNEDLVATVEAIKKQAKPCPSCGEMISKIDGCDQMWCVKCHVQFSWRTGAMIAGYNHNPEYFRWLRETNQEIGRNPGEHGGLPNLICDNNDRNIIRTMRLTMANVASQEIILEGILRYYRHTDFIITQEDFVDRSDKELKHLRVKYLLNEISRAEWKHRIQIINKHLSKQRAYSNVRRLILNVLQNFVERMATIRVGDRDAREKYYKVLREAEQFRIYVNASFIKVSDTYGSSSCPGILENWRETPNLKSFIKTTRINQ